MKIDITKEQYKGLVIMSALANSILGILGDSLTGSDYKKQSVQMEKLEEYLLQYANDFGSSNLIEQYEGKNVIAEAIYEKRVSPILNDYDELGLFETLANKLAWRDFREDHSPSAIKAIAKEHGGYFGLVLYDYEKKYWDEFAKHDCDRLKIVSD